MKNCQIGFPGTQVIHKLLMDSCSELANRRPSRCWDEC